MKDQVLINNSVSKEVILVPVWIKLAIGIINFYRMMNVKIAQNVMLHIGIGLRDSAFKFQNLSHA